MSTETEESRPETDDGKTGEADRMTRREEVEFVRTIHALEREGEHLTEAQKFFRLRRDWDDERVGHLHDDLVEFLQTEAEENEVTVSEIAVALWDELTRLEMMFRRDDDEVESAVSHPADQAGEKVPDHDPSFQ